jgi:RHS repeat-associated protein
MDNLGDSSTASTLTLNSTGTDSQSATDNAINRVDSVDFGSAISTDRLYYLTDGNGNVTALTNDAGAVQESYSYDAYGNATIYDADGTVLSSSAVNNTLLFAGMQVDPTTGLYYDRARWYNPSTGGFITQDPAQAETNLYGYAGNDPISESDPTGLVVNVGYPSTTPGPSDCNSGMGVLVWSGKNGESEAPPSLLAPLPSSPPESPPVAPPTIQPATPQAAQPAANPSGTFSDYTYSTSENNVGGITFGEKTFQGTQYTPNLDPYSAITSWSPYTSQSFAGATTTTGVNSSTFLGASVGSGVGRYNGPAANMAGANTKSGFNASVPGMGSVTVVINPQTGDVQTSVAVNPVKVGAESAGASATAGGVVTVSPNGVEAGIKIGASVDSNPYKVVNQNSNTVVNVDPPPTNPYTSEVYSVETIDYDPATKQASVVKHTFNSMEEATEFRKHNGLNYADKPPSSSGGCTLSDAVGQ